MAQTQILMMLRNAATRCVLRACNAVKCDCGFWGSLQRSPNPLAGFKGAASRREGEGKGGKGGEGKGKGAEGKGGRIRGGEGRLTLMRSRNRAADWLRAALIEAD